MTKAISHFLERDAFIPNMLVDGVDRFGIDLKEKNTLTNGEITHRKTFDSGYKANLIGRLLSAIVDTGTVLLVYLLGRELFNRKSGIVAAILQTFTVLHLQYSHFYGAEPWVAFFVTLTTLLSIKLYKSVRSRRKTPKLLHPKLALCLISTGVVIGLGAASKLSAIAVGIVPIVTFALCFRERVRDKTRSDVLREVAKFLGFATILVLAAASFFRIFQPYAFDGLFSFDTRFLSDLKYLTSVNSGADVPWVIQWVGRTPLWYPLQSVFWHGMGPPLTCAVAIGISFVIYEIIAKGKRSLLIPLSFVILMLSLVSQQFNPLIRYLLPAYPIAITFGGYGIYRLWKWGEARTSLEGKSKVLGQVGQVAAVVLVGGTLFWGTAFVNGIYNNTHPRIEASKWINQNIDSGSTITHQIWDDSLPLNIQGEAEPKLNYVNLDLFRSDRSIDPASEIPKIETLLNNLDTTDYIVEASNRLYDSIPRMPSEYPGTTAYYDALFNGRLGFELVATFDNSPTLFGVTLPDSGAEETFTVYDHPRVSIWSKSSEWSRTAAEEILNPFHAVNALNLEPKGAASNGLLLRPSQTEALQNDLTFNETFSERGYFGIGNWIWWLLWLQLAAFTILPWSTLLFSRLGDGGYGLSKALGFVSVGLLLWLLVVWDFTKFGRASAVASMAIVSGIGGFLWWIHRVRMRDLFSKRRRVWIVSEFVFLAVFFLLLALRSMNPDLWESYLGGEKPMELGYLTAIGRSPELPPYDPWFAGGSMNYYYFGWFLIAVPMRALKILPEVAFQLGVATFGALAAVVVFSLTYNLVSASNSSKTVGKRSSRIPIKVGILGVFLFLGSGTIDATRVHFARLRSANTWTFMNDWPVAGSLVDFVGGTWAWITGTHLSRFDWWAPSRVNEGNFDITEFPYFTFLFGDLHPHMMDMALYGLSLSLALTYLLSCREQQPTGNLPVLAACMGAFVGIVRMTNTWDFPTTVVMMFIVLLFGAGISTSRRDQRFIERKAALLGVAGLAVCLSTLGSNGNYLVFGIGAVGLLAMLSSLCSPITKGRILHFTCHVSIGVITYVVLMWPYLRDTQTFNVGIHRAEWTSPLVDFLSHWGVYFAIALSFFTVLFFDSRHQRRISNVTIHFLPDLFRKNIWRRILFTISCFAFLFLCERGVSAAFAITVLGGFCGLVLVDHEYRKANPDLGKLFALLMFILGFAVAGGPEIITINNDVARMNTVFKFWLQGWLFFAIGSAFAMHHIWQVMGDAQTKRQQLSKRTFKLTPQWGWRIVTIAVVMIGLTYPLLATKPRVEVRFDTSYQGLNGIEYLKNNPSIIRRDTGPDGPLSEIYLADDLPLIIWLRSNVAGSPTIVEWSGDSYDWNSRIATHTGLPTVLGWASHQYQQRQDYAELINGRHADIQRFYSESTPETISEFLLTYDVKYVIVGTQEHRFGTVIALRSFQNHPALQVVFRDGRNIIYAVETDTLWSPLRT
jgi:YYY domain-containing protein